MLDILLIFLGGGLGSVARYLLSKTITHQMDHSFFLGTLTVNVVGCFLIGLIYGIVDKHRLAQAWIWLTATGFCGGFTTFSTFAYENNKLIKNEEYLISFVYITMSLLWGIAGTFLGILIGKKI